MTDALRSSDSTRVQLPRVGGNDYDEAELKDVSSMADFANLRSKQKVLARYLPDDPESIFPAGYYVATVVHDKVRGEGLLFKARYNTLRLDFDGF